VKILVQVLPYQPEVDEADDADDACSLVAFAEVPSVSVVSVLVVLLLLEGSDRASTIDVKSCIEVASPWSGVLSCCTYSRSSGMNHCSRMPYSDCLLKSPSTVGPRCSLSASMNKRSRSNMLHSCKAGWSVCWRFCSRRTSSTAAIGDCMGKRMKALSLSSSVALSAVLRSSCAMRDFVV